MKYRVDIDKKAAKELHKKFSNLEQKRIACAILSLATDQRPKQSKKLVGLGGNYRLRVGETRIVYSIDDPSRVVQIHKIKTRGSSTLYMFSV